MLYCSDSIDLSRDLHAGRIKVEAAPTEEAGDFGGCTTIQFRCHLCPFDTESQPALVDHIKGHRVSHAENGSGDLQGLDANLHQNPGTWCGSSSAGDKDVAEESLDIDAGLNNALCAVTVQTATASAGRICCPLCPFTSYKKAIVTRHIRSHTQERPFRCSICSRAFTLKENLTRHAATHQRRYRCELCPSVWFHTKADLVQHMYSHTGKKVHRCNICSRAFPNKSKLATHIPTHTGEKPFQCEYCSLSFCQKMQLVIHTRKHTGEKPFVCNVCSQAFTSKGVLQGHLNTHKGEKSLQ